MVFGRLYGLEGNDFAVSQCTRGNVFGAEGFDGVLNTLMHVTDLEVGFSVLIGIIWIVSIDAVSEFSWYHFHHKGGVRVLHTTPVKIYLRVLSTLQDLIDGVAWSSNIFQEG